MPPTHSLLRPSPAPYTSGRGLFLTQSVSAGQLLLHLPNPLVAVPDDRHLGSSCSWCLRWVPQRGKLEEGRKEKWEGGWMGVDGGEGEGEGGDERKGEEQEEMYPDPGIEDIDVNDIDGCEGHGGVEKGLVRCSGCKVVWYCGKECQKSDFTPRPSRGSSSGIHKLECPIFLTLSSQSPPKILPTSTRVLAKLLFLLQYPPGPKSHPTSSQPPPPWFAPLPSLQSHTPAQLSHPTRGPMIPLMSSAAGHYTKTTLPAETVLQIYCTTLVNSFSITTPSGNEVLGNLFDPTLALFNHSCAPSCAMEVDGRDVRVYALKEMGEGEEATLAYIDVDGEDGESEGGVKTKGEERRKELRERWFFECRCERCRGELGEEGD